MPKLPIRFNKIWGASLLCISTLVLMATPAHASLQARDLDGNGITDAFYDTTLDITWLRNANVNGAMNWADANTWVNGYRFGGYSDGRLPTMLGVAVTSPCNYSFGGTNCGCQQELERGLVAEVGFHMAADAGASRVPA